MCVVLGIQNGVFGETYTHWALQGSDSSRSLEEIIMCGRWIDATSTKVAKPGGLPA
jgi:hypothetical protein